MKLLIIDKTAVLNSFRTKWIELSKYPDVEVHLLIPDRWIENYSDYKYETSNDEPIKIYAGRVLFPGYENRGMYYLKIFQVVQKVRPDVILLMEEPYSLFALQTVLARHLFASNSRLIFFTWDNLTYHFHHFYLPPGLYRMVDKLTLQCADMALCANEEAVKVLQSKNFNKPIKVIHYGVDLETFRKAPLLSLKKNILEKEIFLVGYVGRMVKQKGIEILIKAFARLPDRCRLILIGKGPYLPSLSGLADSLGIRDRIEHHSSLNPEDIPRFMHFFDTLVLPSLTTRTWKEQFGRVLVEAMASGCPVIGSTSGAIPEIIGDAGIIVPEGDQDALSKALIRLLNEPELRRNLSAKGLIRSEMFSLEKFCREVYDACISIGKS